MTLQLVLAVLAGVSFAAAYLLWPRPITAGEWVARRRAAEGVTSHPTATSGVRWPRFTRSRPFPSVLRLPADLSHDLALLRLTDTGLPTDEEQLRERLLLAAPVAAAVGLVAGLAVHVLRGFVGFPSVELLLPLATGVGAPLLLLRLVTTRAGAVRGEVEQNLPRVLTGARMMLESGAATPEAALVRAAALYRDPATALLREAGRIREVELVSVDVALDRVAAVYGVGSMSRLADAYRIATQYGSGVGDVIADQAENLRQKSEADERSRITSAPVRMVIPAIAFYITPILAVILFVVIGQLMIALRQV